jgi:predicted O-linked N-acetylglucosamine transferase (SPINDLY family)
VTTVVWLEHLPFAVASSVALDKLPDMANIGEWMGQGWRHHQAGALQMAEQYYRQVLHADPSHIDALYLCGVVRHVQGDFDEAIALYRRALAIRPQHLEVINNLGAALSARGRLQEAVDCYRHVLQANPNYPDAYNNLGIALTELGALDGAVAALENAVRLNSFDASFHYNLARALQRQGRLEEAEPAYRQSLALRPDVPEVLNDLATTLVRLGQPDEAIALFRHVLALSPQHAEANNNLGAALAARGRYDEAIESYLRAVELKPGYIDACDNLAMALIIRGRADEAEDWLRHALLYAPNLSMLWNNLGNALKEQGKLEEARHSFRQAMELQPAEPKAHDNFLACLSYDPSVSPAELLEAHQEWGRRCMQAVTAGPHPAHDRNPDRRLRVGYLSPDLCNHPVAHFLAPVVDHHDPTKVETYCYAEVLVPDTMTHWFRTRAQNWRWSHRMDDTQLAEQIRSDGIDILVELAGHTAGSRLRALAQRPAPVQIAYVGYPSTTGLETVDYWLTDDVVDPPGVPTGSTEQLVRLPGCFCCYAPPRLSPEITPLPALRAGHLTLGSLQNLAKINSTVLDLWCRLLLAVPSARLLVFRHSLRGRAREHLLRQFELRGIGADRLDLRHTPADSDGYLGVYRSVDLSLDTLPWSGHTTACESLWMGVPMLTLCGDRHAGRMAASVLHCVGLDEFVAGTPDEFVAQAVGMAGNLEQLAQLRMRLRRRVQDSPLCNSSAFTRGLEAVYRDLWHRWCRSKVE